MPQQYNHVDDAIGQHAFVFARGGEGGGPAAMAAMLL